MRRTSFLGQLSKLPREKQLLAIMSAAAIISCFMPWYGINSRVINEWWNAFGSIGSVAGYIILAFGLTTLAMVTLPALKPELDLTKRLPFSESSLLVFLSAQSFFTSVIFIPVYAQYSLINATNSGTRFGLYMALASTLIGSIVALAYHQKVQRGDAPAAFASVPRTHSDISEWEEEGEYAVQEDPEAQEQMFETTEAEPVASYQEERNIVADTSDDDYRNLYS